MMPTWGVRYFTVLLLFLSAGAYAQSSSQEPAAQVYPSQEVVKANTRLVVVDVVVTDSKGQPVPDLKVEDFNLLEDGRHQTISSFSFQRPASDQGAPSTPSGMITNAPRFKATSLNVILEDVLNGESISHAYAQDRLIQFLKTDPAIQPTAVFVLEKNGMRMLRDFTTDTRSLSETLARFVPQGIARVSGVDVSASVFSTKGAFHSDERSIQVTLHALSLLAQTLAGYPGRKNLIWISEGFPVNLKADGLTQTPFPHPAAGSGNPAQIARQTESAATSGNYTMPTVPADTIGNPQGGAPVNSGQDYASELARTANALMNAHVALYPIDSASLGQTDRLSSQNNMRDLADRTGGKPFYNRNDLETGIRESVDDGATYYTLAYYPDNKAWDGRFREIDVKSLRPGVQLRFRHGYYALDPDSTGKTSLKRGTESLGLALGPDTPGVTSVLFLAGFASAQSKLTVNFAIDLHTISFEQKNDGLEHASVTCVVWAYPDKGKPITSDGITASAALSPEKLQSQQSIQARFPCSQTLSLKPGKYTLKLGVLDRTSNQIGTTTAQFVVP
jgi:VWFA-related protein